MKIASLMLLAVVWTSDETLAHKKLANWHQWRGPFMTGLAPQAEPPLIWDGKNNVKWKTPIPGRGASTPIIWEDRVFVLAAIDTGRKADPKDIPRPDPRFQTKTKPPDTYHQFVVLCLDRATGKIRWQQTATETVPHEGHHETHSYAAASPVTDGKHLYVSFGSRGIYCYDFEGQLQWRRDLGPLHTRLGWGEAVTPALHGSSLVLNWDREADSFITALDTETGKSRWMVPREEPTSWATPLIVEHNGAAQVIVSATKRIRSYDLSTGKELWQCAGMTVNTIPSPVPFEDQVVCMSGYRGSMACSISLDARGEVTGAPALAWRYEQGTPYVPSPLLYEGRLYFTQANTGLLTVLDARTGRPLIERERLPGLTSLYASPIAAAGRIYFTGRDGTTVVIRPGDKVEILASNRLGEPVDASAAAVGHQLFLRGDKHLFCIETP